MTSPTDPPPDQPSAQAPKVVEEMLSSPEFARAIEGDEFRQILDHVPIAIVVSRQSGNQQRICYANVVFQTLLQASWPELEGKTWLLLDTFVHEDQPNLRLGRAIAEGEDFIGTFRRAGDGANENLVQAYVGRIENEDGSENYRIAALVDVTTRERALREAYEQEIRDKDMLLKELQHRVKNNLQLITALIRLEARNAQRGDVIDFNRLAGRIESLALLYQALSTDGLGSTIDLAPYLSEIASAAVRTYSRLKIALDLKLSPAPVSVNVAMPVGLLVNELLTNAFKYAFPSGDGGRLSVACSKTADDRYRVVVTDDGCGIPPGVTWPERGKLGALILQTLRENTREADLRVDSAPVRGTRVTIEFVTKPTPKPH